MVELYVELTLDPSPERLVGHDGGGRGALHGLGTVGQRTGEWFALEREEALIGGLVAGGLVQLESRTVGGQVMYSQVIVHLFLETDHLSESYALEEGADRGVETEGVHDAGLVVVSSGVGRQQGYLVQGLVQQRQHLGEGTVVVLVELDVLVVVDHLQTPLGHQRLVGVEQHFGLVTLFGGLHLLGHFFLCFLVGHVVGRKHAGQELGANTLVESDNLLFIVKL